MKHAEAPTAVLEGRSLLPHWLAAMLAADNLINRGFRVVILYESDLTSWQTNLSGLFSTEIEHVQLHRPGFFSMEAFRVAGSTAWGLLLCAIPHPNGFFQVFINHFGHNKVKVGDLIYDTHIRWTDPSAPGRAFLQFTKTLWSSLRRLSRILPYTKQADLIGYSTPAYSSVGGLMARISRANVNRDLYALELTPFPRWGQLQGYFDERLKCSVEESANTSHTMREAWSAVERRSQGLSAYADARIAYRPPHVQGAAAVLPANLNSGGKVALVAAHCFSDAVHVLGTMVFRDYYQWVSETLHWFTKNAPSCIVIVKEHPSAWEYNESGLLEKMVHDFTASSILFAPASENVGQLIGAADFVVTARGTIGMEAVAQGVPVVVAGETPYKALGIVEEPGSKKHYFLNLASAAAGSLPSPTPDERDRAALAILSAESNEGFPSTLLSEESSHTLKTFQSDLGFATEKQSTHLKGELRKSKYYRILDQLLKQVG